MWDIGNMRYWYHELLVYKILVPWVRFLSWNSVLEICFSELESIQASIWMYIALSKLNCWLYFWLCICASCTTSACACVCQELALPAWEFKTSAGALCPVLSVNSSDVKHCTVELLLTALEDDYSGTSPGLLLSTRYNSQCAPGTPAKSPILLVGYSVLLSSALGGDKVGV